MHPLSKKSISLRAYTSGVCMTLDFETSLIDFDNWDNSAIKVVMVAWKMSDEKQVRDHYGNVLECAQFWKDLERADFVCGQNIKFDLHRLLQQLDYDVTQKLSYDTKVAEKVLLGNRVASLSLSALAPKYGFEEGKEVRVDTQMKMGVEPEDIDPRYLRARCRRDVRQTEGIMRKQIKKLRASGKLNLVLTRCMLTPILTEIEATGICLDKERVLTTHAEYARVCAEKKRELDEFTGGINLKSRDQLAHFLYGGGLVEKREKVPTGELYKNGNPKTRIEVCWVRNPGKTLRFPQFKDKKGRVKKKAPSKSFPDGMPKTDKNTMSWLLGQAETEEQKQFVQIYQQYGRLTAALSKNLEFFKGVVDERPGGIFYGEFNQTTTATHRLSSSGLPQKFEQFPKSKSVQFQNMPRVFKSLFKARDPDYFMVEADGSQLEFRVAAFLGQDAQAMADIRNPDFDAHVTSASVMNQIPYEEALARHRGGDKTMKELRTLAKPDTFKPLYGGTQGTPEQMRWYEEFQNRYSDLYAEQTRWVEEVTAGVGKYGSLRTEWGMEFFFQFYLNDYSGEPMDAVLHKSIRPSVFNYPVQSLATAEIIPIALIFLFHRVRKAGLKVLFCNTVHDSIIAEVHKDDMEAYKELCFRCFTDDVYEYLHSAYKLDFNVPLGAEVGWGSHWSEGQEQAIDKEPPMFEEAA